MKVASKVVLWEAKGGGGGPPPPTPVNEYLHPALGLATDYGGTEFIDGVSYTMGTWFTVMKKGSITAVKFWKAAADGASSHTVAIYQDTNHTAVAVEVTSSEPPGPCWIEVPLSSPVVVATDAAGPTDFTHIYCTAVYRVAYYAATGGALLNGHYTTNNVLYAISSGELHATDSAITGNGVFNQDGFPAYPTDAFNDTYYWVDVRWTGFL